MGIIRVLRLKCKCSCKECLAQSWTCRKGSQLAGQFWLPPSCPPLFCLNHRSRSHASPSLLPTPSSTHNFLPSSRLALGLDEHMCVCTAADVSRSPGAGSGLAPSQSLLQGPHYSPLSNHLGSPQASTSHMLSAPSRGPYLPLAFQHLLLAFTASCQFCPQNHSLKYLPHPHPSPGPALALAQHRLSDFCRPPPLACGDLDDVPRAGACWEQGAEAALTASEAHLLQGGMWQRLRVWIPEPGEWEVTASHGSHSPDASVSSSLRQRQEED